MRSRINVTYAAAVMLCLGAALLMAAALTPVTRADAPEPVTQANGCTPDTSGNLTGTEWWVYHIYYNSEEGTENSNYHIMNVRENSMGTHTLEYDDCGQRDANGDGSGFTQSLAKVMGTCPCRPTSVCRNPSGFNNIDWTGVFVDHSMAYTGTGDSSVRHRIVATGFGGTFVPASANNEMIDMEWGVKHNSAITQTDMYQIPRTFDMTAGNGCPPSNVQVSWDYQTNPATTGDEPAGMDGYPFAVNSTTRQSWQFVYADGRYLGSSAPNPSLFEKGYRWAVATAVADYDVDANCEAADVTTEKFDVYEVQRNPRYYGRCPVGGGAGIFTPPTGGVSFNTDQAVNTWYWWNDSVKNYVRALDRDAYFGREDWGIKAWESRRTYVYVNGFSDAGTGFDINVTVTNNCQTCDAGNFSVLALIMDMDAVTATNSVPYVNGKTIYPDVGSR